MLSSNINDTTRGTQEYAPSEPPHTSSATPTLPDTLSSDEVVDPRPVHPDAKALFAVCPWTRYIPVFGQSVEAFGPKCTFSLGLSYFLCKGVADQLISGGAYTMFVNRYGISDDRYQRLSCITTMGWSVKALTAMLCDAFAFLGYTKRWYMLISCVAGAVFALVYGLLPAKSTSANTACACVFLTSFCKANVDILSEGHYSRQMRRNPAAGPALVSSIWWFIMVGSIVAAGVMGPVADQGIPQVGVFVSAALQLITGIIFVFNWYGEKTNREERMEDQMALRRAAVSTIEGEEGGHQEKDAASVDRLAEKVAEEGDKALLFGDAATPTGTGFQELVMGTEDDLALHDELDAADVGPMLTTNADVAEMEAAEEEALLANEPLPVCFGFFTYNREVVRSQWRIFVYSIMMTCAVVAMTCGNILADTLGLLIICIVASVICCGFSFWALPMVIAKANVFCFLQAAVYISVSAPLTAFYVAKPDCVADGPHFNFTFYNTVGTVIGNCAGLVGVWCFNFIFAKLNYQLTFAITTLIQIIAGVFDIIIVKRWNIDIGIPDHAMYICGDAVIGQMCYMLGFMPLTILLSRLVPRGSESVMYALLAGFSNLGQSVASSLGAILMEYGLPVATDAPHCDFSNMPWLLFISHICTPLLVIPLSFILIPFIRICDDVDDTGKLKRESILSESEDSEAKPLEQGASGASGTEDDGDATAEAAPRECSDVF